MPSHRAQDSGDRYLNNRRVTYQLPSENMKREHNTILKILTNNKYDTSIMKTLSTKKGKKKNDEKTVGKIYIHR